MYDTNRIILLWKSLSQDKTLMNFTITFDPKRINLVQAWNIVQRPRVLLNQFDIDDDIKSQYILFSIEQHNGSKKHSNYPHIHGQVIYKYMPFGQILNLQQLVVTSLRKMYGRSEFIQNYEQQQLIDLPIHITDNHRIWIEYVLKECNDNYIRFKPSNILPLVLHSHKNDGFELLVESVRPV